MTFEELQEEVINWGVVRDLIHRENHPKQFMKFIEEVFEFKAELDHVERVEHKKLKEIYAQDMKLEMGDIFVTLIILCEQLGIEPVKCLEMAYKKISVRKGITRDGQFIKEEDL